MVNQALHLQQVSEVLQLDLATLRALNPQYRRDIIPGNTRPSALKLPAAATYAFVGQEDTIYKHRMEEYLANIPIHNEEAQNSKATTRERITHVVLQGENLYTIANRYGVTAKDIRKWNGLGSNRVAKGKRLKLYVDNGGIAFAAAKPTTSTTKSTASSSTAKTAITTKAATSTNGKEFIAYTVKSGDSLYSIAKKYPGVSTKDLQQANGLKGSDIRPGQVLKIPVG